jgi:predicted benzoate:H+ symporter BenE
VIKFSPAFVNNLGCGSSNVADTHAAIMWENDPDEKAKYASVLMAMAGNMRIGLGISGCLTTWGGGIPIVYRVDVAG